MGTLRQRDRLAIAVVEGANRVRDLFSDDPAAYERTVPPELAAHLPRLMHHYRESAPQHPRTRARVYGGAIGNLVQDIQTLAQHYFPPCMRRIHDVTNVRHLHFEERRRFAWFLFEVGWTVDEVTECWWRLWGKASAHFREMSLEEFRASSYGSDVRGLAEFARDKPPQACSTMIKGGETRQFCPYADGGGGGTGDIEDLVKGCRSECSRRLYPDGGTTLFSPIKHYRVARAKIH